MTKETSPKLVDKLSTIKRTVFILDVFTLLLAALPARATDVYYYSPEHVTNITGRALADAAPPYRLLNMSVFGTGSNAVSQAITSWQVGDFSGVTSPAPVGNYQRGNNAGYGSTAVQMTDMEMGGMLNTWSISGGSGYNYNLANLQVKYEWKPSDNTCLWTHTNSNLRFQFSLRIPEAYAEAGACGYVYSSLLIQDQNGKSFWIQPAIFDTRGTPSTEFIGWDAGTSSGYVDTYYAYNYNDTRYCSKDGFSYWATNATWNSWRIYSFTISRAQLLNAVNDMNANFGSGLSTNLAGYRVVMFTVQDEIYWPTGNCNLSIGVRDLYLSENY